MPPGEYTDGQPIFSTITARYFNSDSSFRDPKSGALQKETYFMLKSEKNDFPENIPPDSRFVTANGETYDIRTVKRIFNHFDNVFEALKITVM